jgi:glycerophosphoryl diester phosphodiesterase
VSRPLIFGHRGASAHVRANTVEAYALAVAAGADGVELDVRRSRDGALVIHHDDRVAPDEPPLVEFDLRQIKATTPWVPTLDEAWDAIGPSALLNIEIKNDPREADHDSSHSVAQPVADWIENHETDARILVSSFNWGTLDVVKRLAPEVPTGMLARGALDPFSVIARAGSAGHISVNLSLTRTLPDAERIVDAAGDLAVLVWTVNDPDDALALAAAGVGGIFTDDPALMVETFSGRS